MISEKLHKFNLQKGKWPLLLQETVKLFTIYNNQIHSFDFTCLLILVGIKIYDRRFPRSCHVNQSYFLIWFPVFCARVLHCDWVRVNPPISQLLFCGWITPRNVTGTDKKKSFFYVIILNKKLYKVIKSWEKISLLLDCLINFFIKISWKYYQGTTWLKKIWQKKICWSCKISYT